MKISPLERVIAGKLGMGHGQPLEPDAVRGYQLDRLAETIAYARKNSPFYRTKLAALGDRGLAGEELLAELPFTSEEELRRHGRKMLCVSQDEVARIITMHSSGTTGEPKRLFFSGDDLEQTLDFFQHGMRSLVEPGEKVLILLPGKSPDSTGDLLARALARMDVDSHVHGLVADPEQAAKEIFGDRYQAIVGFPVQILALARCAAALELDTGPIQSVLLCSDYIPQAACTALEAMWRCRVFSHYGTVETGLGGGVECEARNGCHLRESDLLFEVVCPRTGTIRPPGEFGEIVFSTLNRRAMPLIRYRTGDHGRLLPGPCACGSTIRRLDRVRGRINQERQLKNGHRLAMADLDEALLSVPGVLDFQAFLDGTAKGDRLTLRFTVLKEHAANPLYEAASRLRGLAALEDVQMVPELSTGSHIWRGKRLIKDNREGVHHEKTH